MADPMVILRNIANQANQNVGYDANTKSVTIAGNSYTPNQLQGMGGQLVNGQWNLPSSSANHIVGNNVSQQQQMQASQQNYLSNLSKYNSALSDSYYNNQMSQLQTQRDSQLSGLNKSYEGAVGEGNVASRQATADYEQQKAEIEKEAYLNSEQTQLYGQEMGIQNSQQMAGIMAGDNARNQGLVNENMTTRDRRVADIKDRLNSLKLQRDLDVTNTNNAYESGLLGAQSQSQMLYNQNMNNLLMGDYSAQRDQMYNLQGMDYQGNIQRNLLGNQNAYSLEGKEVDFQNSLKTITHQSNEAIKQMTVSNSFDMNKISVLFQQDMQKLSTQYGIQSSLSSQSAQQASKSAMDKVAIALAQRKAEYDMDTANALRGVTPGTDEYDIIQGNAQMKLEQGIANDWNSALAGVVMGNVVNSTEPTLPKPKWNDFNGSQFQSDLSKYNTDKSRYDKEQSSINASYDRYYNMMFGNK